MVLNIIKTPETMQLSCVFEKKNTFTHWGQDKIGHFADDIFKWIFLNENVWISIDISLKFVPRGPINNIPTLV